VSGLVLGLPAPQYHARPALSAGGAVTLVEKCPAAYWHSSPHNPAATSEHRAIFDVGTAAHYAVLEPDVYETRVVELPFDDYRTKEARELREAAWAEGKTPLLRGDVDRVVTMRAAIHAHPIAAKAFAHGDPEVSFFWVDRETGAECKARADWLPRSRRYIVDLKTGASAHPRAFERLAVNLGHFQRAAWYVDGLKAITGETAAYWFVLVERDTPHLVSVCTLDDEALAWGRRLNAAAMASYVRCLERGEWPGYRPPDSPDQDKAFRIGLPGWAGRALEKRDEKGEFTEQLTRLAYEMQAPLERAEA
jgi:hypothetical protein